MIYLKILKCFSEYYTQRIQVVDEYVCNIFRIYNTENNLKSDDKC
jgi:hypothetical protein